MRVGARGKTFLLDGSPFRFRAVRYAPGATTAGSAPGRLVQDLAAVAGCGFSVVSLPALPAPAIQAAVDSGLRFILELEADELAASAWLARRERWRVVRELAMRARYSARQWAGDDALLGVTLGLPPALEGSHEHAELVRRMANELAASLHDDQDGLLVGWRSSSAHDRDCPADFEYLIAAVPLRRRHDLAVALMECHTYVGDRPLVLGEVSVTGSEPSDDADPGWMFDTALRCGVAGVLRPASPPEELIRRSSRMAELNRRTVRDLDVAWPAISVVINTYNAQDTLEECLRHCERLAYPRLETIVVDDGSTDDSRAIAAVHPSVRLVAMSHKGLSEGRNVGYRSARGDLVAYLDADAYPSPEWPWYLALAALADRVAGAGGPNVPPPDDPAPARAVSLSSGGPVPQLSHPDRAVHVPGCNMAFWRHVLEEMDGFDSVLQSAEDVEFEWRVREAGYAIAYHPAALIWHHPRVQLARYLRQQRHYGRGQAILERRCPERFPLGYRLRNATARLRPRTHRGNAGGCAVSYVTVAHHDRAAVELAHQWGMPLAVGLALTAPLGLVRRRLATPALAAAVFTASLFATDMRLAAEGRRRPDRTLGFIARVAAFRLLRPLAFRWGHLKGWLEFIGAGSKWPPRPGELARQSGTPMEPAPSRARTRRAY